MSTAVDELINVAAVSVLLPDHKACNVAESSLNLVKTHGIWNPHAVRRLRRTLLAKTLGAKPLSRAARLRASSLGVDDVSGAPARYACMLTDAPLFLFVYTTFSR